MLSGTLRTMQPVVHVAVVGSGLAGLSATIEAYRQGAQVTLFEKEPKLGGNSAKASSGMNAVGTLAQQVGCIEDSVDAFYEDTVRSGGSRSDPWLVQRLVSLSKEAHAFLESFGIQLNQLSQCGGHRFPRTHREAPDGSGQPKSVGWDIVKALQKYIETEMHTKSNPSFGSIQFKMNTQVLDLIVDQGRVKGIKFTHTNSTAPTEPLFGTSSSSSSSIEVTSLMTDAVILTTGGFSANTTLLSEFSPELVSFPTTNGMFAQGDGIELGRQVGTLVDMDQVQLHPTAFVPPSSPSSPPLKESPKSRVLAPEALRGHGGILVNAQGHRFVNELGTRQDVVKAILKQPGPVYLVLFDEGVQAFGTVPFQFYLNQRFFQQVWVHEFHDLEKTLLKYQHMAHPSSSSSSSSLWPPTSSGSFSPSTSLGLRTDVFGKSVFPNVPRELPRPMKVYVAQVAPALHYCMGGLKINQCAQVIQRSSPLPTTTKTSTISSSVMDTHALERGVPGLFAAGEVTGGIHGQNRLAGNSLLDCVVFGRIAGRQASSSQRQPSNPPTLTFTSPPSSRIPSLLGRLKATFLSTLSLSLSTTPSSSSFTCTSCTPPSYDDQVMVGMVTLFLALFPLWMLFHRWVRKRHVPL